ncbi:hypothetical protein VNO77_21280 [Canavalia gladiata]|uniref:GOLD domain-containing protein n=1 Tax=Canavalia gladiata TaxID=3824 RepID=A0AAN9LUX7_CANGL
MSNPILVLIVIAPALMCTFVNSMQFELKQGHPKCISEDINSNAITMGNYFVVNPSHAHPVPHSRNITVTVRSPYGNDYHHGSNVNSGNFTFAAAESGEYTACFSVPSNHDPALTVTIDFVWRTGVVANDWSMVAKRGQIEAMEFELKKLYDSVKYIHNEMFYLREREKEMQDLNRATNSKMFTFTFLSILVCLSVAGLQLWHLKTFFEKKKLL